MNAPFNAAAQAQAWKPGEGAPAGAAEVRVDGAAVAESNDVSQDDQCLVLNAEQLVGASVRKADVRGPDRGPIADYMAGHPETKVFHRFEWVDAIERSTGHRAYWLVAERSGMIVGVLALHAVRSRLFGNALVSTGFAVDGGILADDTGAAQSLANGASGLAKSIKIYGIELRGGRLPHALAAQKGSGWSIKDDAHAGFVNPLATDDEAQLLAIPRKQRAEVRKGQASDLTLTIGNAPPDRAAHYAVYAESVRNLGTPVFPRRLFEAVLDEFEDNADILTVWQNGTPLSSVLSLYHRGAVMPYWGGGVYAARGARANEVMYFELMRHARLRGCDRFDFGRSKVNSGAYHFKRNWGFEPQPLAYASWSPSGEVARDVNPNSPRYKAQIALWQKLPMPVAKFIGPLIAKGLG